MFWAWYCRHLEMDDNWINWIERVIMFGHSQWDTGPSFRNYQVAEVDKSADGTIDFEEFKVTHCASPRQPRTFCGWTASSFHLGLEGDPWLFRLLHWRESFLYRYTVLDAMNVESAVHISGDHGADGHGGGWYPTTAACATPPVAWELRGNLIFRLCSTEIQSKVK